MKSKSKNAIKSSNKTDSRNKTESKNKTGPKQPKTVQKPENISTNYPNWEVLMYKKISLSSPILIEGMPGIGNVGKIVMDVLIEESKANLFMTFFSNQLPNNVFVNEENLVDLPKLSLYHKNINNQDYLFLTGDVQPINEQASYEFSGMIIELFKRFNGKYLITLGGIGLNDIPSDPKVYITGNNSSLVNMVSKNLEKKKIHVETKIYGHVGPILGVSGVLLGISKKNDMAAYSLLSETFGHPIYVGLKAAKAILNILNHYYDFKINLEKIDKEIKQIDAQMQGLNNDSEISEDAKDKMLKYKKYSDVNYIG